MLVSMVCCHSELERHLSDMRSRNAMWQWGHWYDTSLWSQTLPGEGKGTSRRLAVLIWLMWHWRLQGRHQGWLSQKRTCLSNRCMVLLSTGFVLLKYLDVLLFTQVLCCHNCEKAQQLFLKIHSDENWGNVLVEFLWIMEDICKESSAKKGVFLNSRHYE